MFISGKESYLRDFLKDRGCLLLLTRIPTYSWSITAGIPFHQQMKGIPSIKVLVEKVLRMMISPVYYKYTKGATLGRGSLGQGSLGPKKIGNFLEGKSMGPRLFQGNLGW